eukprot:TRINITY_DN43670_c0_g1_i1.p2 TRINITY_DN43670_c0_g1~~TRINITY_DN43670_c0_g1_i1.p2  ORF type:complete len:300 (+),score=75.95 TRINITY_DN43670_c0_g1_i1:63-962(+)
MLRGSLRVCAVGGRRAWQSGQRRPTTDSAQGSSSSSWLGIPVGAIAGLFGSMVGVGGGVIMVPLLVAPAVGLKAKEAAATSLVAVVGTGATSAVVYGTSGCVDWVGAGALALAAMVTAKAGARFTTKVADRQLKRMFGGFLMLVAPTVPLKDRLFGSCPAKEPEPGVWPGFSSMASDGEKSQYIASLGCTGATAGFLSGLLGIGGGTVVTPLLALVSGMSQQAVLGTSMVAMIAPSATALHQHHLLGNVRWGIGRSLLIGSAAGAAAGSSVAVTADETMLKQLFGVCIFALGARTFVKA